MSDFGQTIAAAYAAEGAVLDLGRGVHEGAVSPAAVVQVPLRTLNRHGLIAGATGTGKTRTLQALAEQLSAAGVCVLAADVKGDVSGMAVPGDAAGPAATRAQELGTPFSPAGFSVQPLALGGLGPGVPVRAAVGDLGPTMLAKVLRSNQTQEQSLQLVFHYADTKGLPLVDLGDLRALLTFLQSKEGKAELEGIGGLSKATVGVLLRALVGLEAAGADAFFGEPQFDVADLLTPAPDGRGTVSLVQLAAVQDRPELWSTVLLWLVAELFETLPEVGDLDRPELVVFLDEAHLLFDDATEAFTDAITRTVRLIRSKGVGLVFVTQQPTDLPDDVLGQLGLRVQHALRAFTPKDAKALKAIATTFPSSEFYDVEALLTAMGTGEAAVTVLDERGVPTPVVHTRIRPPVSRMAPADDVDALAKASTLWPRYAERADPESAADLLAARAEAAAPAPEPTKPERVPYPAPPRTRKRAPKPAEGGVGDFLTSREGRQLQREVVRGVFGLLRKRL